MRLRPASFAALPKLVDERGTPGSAVEGAENRVRSPEKAASTSAPAALIVLCAPGYEGSGAVLPASGSHAGSAVVAGLPSVSAIWIAVTGRQSLYVYLAS